MQGLKKDELVMLLDKKQEIFCTQEKIFRKSYT